MDREVDEIATAFAGALAQALPPDAAFSLVVRRQGRVGTYLGRSLHEDPLTPIALALLSALQCQKWVEQQVPELAEPPGLRSLWGMIADLAEQIDAAHRAEMDA